MLICYDCFIFNDSLIDVFQIFLFLNCPFFKVIKNLLCYYQFLHIAISKNVVRDNDECQLSNGDCTTEKKCGY